MTLWQLIRASVYSPDFYRSLLDRPFSFSLKYFFTLAVVLAVVFATSFSFIAIPAANEFLGRVGQELVARFPENLAITVKGGAASVNQPEPYVLPMPEELVKEYDGGESNAPKNLLVVDTREPFSIERFNGTETAVYLTRDHIAWSSNGRVTIESVSRFPDVTLDRKFILQAADALRSVGGFLAPLIVFGSFLFFLMLYIFNLLYFFVGGAIAWIIAKARKLDVSYGKAYQMAIHAFTLPAFADMLLWGGFGFPIPFVTTIVLALVLLANMKWEPAQASPVTPA